MKTIIGIGGSFENLNKLSKNGGKCRHSTCKGR